MVDANYSIIGDDVLSEHVYENVYFNEEDNVFVTEFMNNVRAEIASTQPNVTAEQVAIHNYRSISVASRRRRLSQSGIYVSDMYDVVVNASITYYDLERLDLLHSGSTRNVTLLSMEADMQNIIQRSRILGVHTGGVAIVQNTTLQDYAASGLDEQNQLSVEQTASALQIAYSGASFTPARTSAPSYAMYASYPASATPPTPPGTSSVVVAEILADTVARMTDAQDAQSFADNTETSTQLAEIFEDIVSAGARGMACGVRVGTRREMDNTEDIRKALNQGT
ncbi:hypothetical protein CYMTET_38657 [Cymbomonas tetramitiformis]|uniref:Uncharacterized protein n=1 Tax=Cymbomonas tetramitiformis TaxID=36881 RepID=A0AAE0CCU1_9CHLO|nr:hypothetical protein CYMTET_38657 [Cymbomonas tetramitiformis]